MVGRSFTAAMLVFGCLGLGACGVEEEPFAGPDPAQADVERAVQPELWWTCGDPVCSGWTNKGLPRCRNRQAGDPCDAQYIGKECDPHDACNATLMCSDTDPIGGYGCPISRRAAKKDITYVDPSGKKALYDELMSVDLATYRYNAEEQVTPTHLGFIIDDLQVGSKAVAPNGERVDLYGYTSMAVAALQIQNAQIAALSEKVAALEAELAAAKAPTKK